MCTYTINMETDRITVKEVARLAGVSIGTVDRVLHDRGGVSAETKSRIDGIITSLGYEPNLIARHLSLNKTYTFHAILPRPEQDSGYWSLCLAGIRRAERDLEPYGTKLLVDEFDRYDKPAYRALLESIVAEGCDGLLIAPVLPEELLQVLATLKGKLPYAFFDGTVEGAEPLAVIGQDAFAGGYLAGRTLSLLAGCAPGPFVALNAHAEDRHIKLRIEGFKAYIREMGGGRPREALEYPCAELARALPADDFLEHLFRDVPSIAGILVANSSGHVVGDWLQFRDKKEGCALVSWDMVPDNVRSLRDGGIDCLISQRPFEQGREGLERLFRAVVHGAVVHGAVVRGEPDGGAVDIPLEVYFKENLPQRADPISRC